MVGLAKMAFHFCVGCRLRTSCGPREQGSVFGWLSTGLSPLQTSKKPYGSPVSAWTCLRVAPSVFRAYGRGANAQRPVPLWDGPRTTKQYSRGFRKETQGAGNMSFHHHQDSWREWKTRFGLVVGDYTMWYERLSAGPRDSKLLHI